tara:strand:- start:50 stop:523 length:474 start_codon:yes stop_codon:yes gene_type:complete
MAIYKTDGVDGNNHLPKKFVTLNTIIPVSTTITKGELLMIDTSETTNGMGMNVIQATGADLATVIGVAAETIANSSASVVKTTNISVQVAGLNQDCTASSGAVVRAGYLVGSATVQVEEIGDYSSTITTRPIGLCVDQLTASTADGGIMLFDHGFYG